MSKDPKFETISNAQKSEGSKQALPPRHPTLDPRSSGIRRRLTTITASSYLEASDPTIVEGDQDVESNGGRYKKSPL
jgi:hypothetical protein